MKTKIMFYLVLVLLFVFAGNSFGMEEAKEPMDAIEEPPEIVTPENYDEIIGPQGNESGTNTWYGDSAGTNITGAYNSCFGSLAGGGTNLSGVQNTFIGSNAGDENTSGKYNTFVGDDAGTGNTTGEENTFVGENAGYSNNTASYNAFFGKGAGYFNTTGDSNSFFGWGAGGLGTTGVANSYFGADAGHQTEGSYNCLIGFSAGVWNKGSYNTAVGASAGSTTRYGSRNIFIGYDAGAGLTVSDRLIIDSSATDTPLIWGDFAANKVVIYGGFRAIASYSSSDKRWKKNIKPLKSSLDKVSSLQGVSYEWKTDEYPDVGMTEGKQIGLVAQDVEKELPELVSEDKDGYKAVSYTKLTAVLVEAVKELKAENQSQKKLIEEQQNQFMKQQAEIEQLRSMIKELKS